MAQLTSLENLITRWRHFHRLQIWPPDRAKCIICKFDHHMAPLALVTDSTTRSRQLHYLQIWPPHCLGLPYRYYQLVLTWYLHHPESHQLSFTNVLEWRTSGPKDRTPGLPGSDKNGIRDARSTVDIFNGWSIGLVVVPKWWPQYHN